MAGAASTEILALSKMNRNNAQLDEHDALTLRTMYRVGTILKHIPEGARIATRYAYTCRPTTAPLRAGGAVYCPCHRGVCL